jgi:K+-transporting ATPase c subunit
MNETFEEKRNARRERHAAIREEVTSEEAQAFEAEAAENAGALDVPLHLRITRGLDAELRQQAAAEQIPTSALVRRLLTQAVREHRTGGVTEAEVEQIAHRVVTEHVGG